MAELKRRTVVCNIHGLRFDPQLSAGCARCRREGLIPRTRPKFLPLLLAILAFTLIAARLVTAILNDRRAPRTEETTLRSGQADPRIDPASYRDGIEEVDHTLYPVSSVDLSLLASRAGSSGESVAATLIADGHDTAATAIRAFASDLGSADLDTRGLEVARDRWYTLKQRYFLPAEWLVTPRARPTDDPALASAFTSFAADLELLLNDATASGIDDDWIARLDQLEMRRPPQPAFESDSAMVLADRALSESLAAARRAESRSDGATVDLDDALRALDEMNDQLGNLPR